MKQILTRCRFGCRTWLTTSHTFIIIIIIKKKNARYAHYSNCACSLQFRLTGMVCLTQWRCRHDSRDKTPWHSRECTG
ncbi:hypothetical protein V5799_002177 [Amblyomma americanum]|uniref:Uncharacterized protein n=1 Tax=Amblyomma americanum TaxID=6943 RepID=A0AAQ4CY30_AMBAM